MRTMCQINTRDGSLKNKVKKIYAVFVPEYFKQLIILYTKNIISGYLDL